MEKAETEMESQMVRLRGVGKKEPFGVARIGDLSVDGVFIRTTPKKAARQGKEPEHFAIRRLGSQAGFTWKQPPPTEKGTMNIPLLPAQIEEAAPRGGWSGRHLRECSSCLPP